MQKSLLVIIGIIILVGIIIFATQRNAAAPTEDNLDIGVLGIDQDPFIPGEYALDTARSTTTWRAQKILGSGHTGSFETLASSLVVDENGVITSGEATFDLTTITNADLADNPERQAQLLGHLASADFFDTATYPTATYTIASVEANDALPGFTVNGNLDMRGVNAGLAIGTTIEQIDDNTIRMVNSIPFDRTIWGVNFGSENVFDIAKDQVIDDIITLDIDWTFVRTDEE